MQFHCYILQSVTTGKLYIGQTNNLQDRMKRHNAGVNISTRNRGPWELLFATGFETRAEAMTLERRLKNFKNPGKVKEWISRNG